MNTHRSVIKVYTSRKELESWKEFCEARQVSSSEALRAAIRKILSHATPQQAVEFTTVSEAPDKSRKRVHLRLAGSEMEKVLACARAEDISLTQWFVNLTRARLTRDPQLGMTELAVLGESNKQIAAVGSNLNQIARRLNAERSASDNESIARITQEIGHLKQAIDEHLSHVRAVMLANRERWVIQ